MNSPRRSPSIKICAACQASGAIQVHPAIRRQRTAMPIRTLALTLGISALLFGHSAPAATFTYSGQALDGGSTTTPTTGNFTLGFNGNGATGYVTPASGNATVLAFGGPAGDNYTATDDLSGTFNFNGLTFTNAGNVTVAQGAGTTLTEGAATAIALNNSGALNFGLSIDNNGKLTTFSGTGTGTFGGGISGTGGVTLGGSETVTLGGTNAYTGTTTVGTGTTLIVAGSLASATVAVTGTLQLQTGGAIGSSALTLNNGATLQLRADADTSFAPASINSVNTGTVTFDVNQLTAVGGGNTLSLGGLKTANNATNTFNITGGNGDILNFGNVTASSSAGGTYTLTFNATTAAATIGTLTTGNFGTAMVFSGTNDITVGALVEGSNSTNSLTVSGANLTINGATTRAANNAAGSFTVTLGSGTFNINNANVLNNPGGSGATAFTIAGGNLDNTSGAAITEVASTNRVTGDFTFNPNSVAGTTHNLTIAGSTTFSGNRTVTVNAGTLGLGASTGSGTYGVTKAGAGTLTLGGLSVAANSNVQIAASAGTLNLGALSRSTGGTANFNPTSTGTITTTTANSNGILGAGYSYGSGTGLSYATSTAGTITAYTVGTTYTPAATGSGPAFTANTNYNIATGGNLSGTAATIGTLRYTGGTGTLTIPAGGKVTTLGLMNAGTGTLTINGPNGVTNQGIGAGNTGTAEMVVFGNSQPIVINASIVDSFQSGTTFNTSAVTYNTAGDVTLNALNTYRGATSVLSGNLVANATNTLATTSSISVASGAMLSLAANNALATPVAPTTTSTAPGTPGTATGQVAVTLNGGTLLRNGTGISLGTGTTVGAGALTLTATSTLDFGTTGAGTLNFNAFVDTSNFTLTVNDYNNPTNATRIDGTDDRLIFNQQLTATQLADISFGGTAAMQVLLGNGEYEVLPAVPEPSTWMSGLLFVGAAGCLRLRQLRRRSVA